MVGRTDADAGIRHQHVEPLKTLLDLGDDLDPALLVGDVLPQIDRFAAGARDGLHHIGAAAIVDVGDDHLRALARERRRTRRADAGRAAGDQRDFSLNLTH